MNTPKEYEGMAVMATKPLDEKERALMLAKETSMWLNVAKFEQCQRIAQMLSKTDFVPAAFRNNVGNCMIAMDLADRMRAHPLMIMQTMYIVHGRPGFEGKLLSALVNNSGRYKDPLEYEWKGEEGKPAWGCRAYATRKSTGKVVKGPWVDWKMVVAEGWNKPKGYGDKQQQSKWVTMPELMFMYRAAAYFVNANDSDLKMGMQTVEEIEDVELVSAPDGTYTTGDGPKTKDLYKPTKKPTIIAKEALMRQPVEGKLVGSTEDEIAKVADGEQQTDPKPEPDKKPEPKTEEDEYRGPWVQTRWRLLKSPGMLKFAKENAATWIGAPDYVKAAFRAKWDVCKELDDTPFPFVMPNDTGPEETEPADNKKPEPEPTVPDRLKSEFVDIWEGGDKEGIEYASSMLGCGGMPPNEDSVPAWVTFYRAFMKKKASEPQW